MGDFLELDIVTFVKWGSMSYLDELTKAMTWLGEQKDTIFIGQSVAYSGNTLYKTLVNVPDEKKIELPVAEELQMGLSIGLSLGGYVPISIYPRFDFLLCATNQLVNHLDKLEEMSHGEFKAKVIIRTCIGATKPMYPGIQHCCDYTEAFKLLLKTVRVDKLLNADEVLKAYQRAYFNDRSTLLIEGADLYGSG